jgi:hypothetical protein
MLRKSSSKLLPSDGAYRFKLKQLSNTVNIDEFVNDANQDVDFILKEAGIYPKRDY